MTEWVFETGKSLESEQKCSGQCKQNSELYSSGSSTDRILQLQRTAGNQAVQRLIKSRAFQAKLRISQPNDIYEQEADRVAEHVMRMPDPVLRRKCAKCDEDKYKVLRAKESPGQVQGNQDQDIPFIVHDVLRSPGQPLEPNTRAFMEQHFDHDFSKVRVHSGSDAEQSARDMNANAYTVGQNIVFSVGRFAPGTQEGQRLMAHELTHVVQQTKGFSTFQLQRAKASGLDPSTPRTDSDEETQRLDAIKIVQSECSHIFLAAKTYKVTAEAIAGAILWEALENPYYRQFSRLGPGKVHYTESFEKSEAEKVEEEKRVTPSTKDSKERKNRLLQPKWAITYIAAIMRRHADNYQTIAGVDISANTGVLCTLYQGGKSEERAKNLAARRKADPKAQPTPGDEMGPWVEKNIDFVKKLLLCP